MPMTGLVALEDGARALGRGGHASIATPTVARYIPYRAIDSHATASDDVPGGERARGSARGRGRRGSRSGSGSARPRGPAAASPPAPRRSRATSRRRSRTGRRRAARRRASAASVAYRPRSAGTREPLRRHRRRQAARASRSRPRSATHDRESALLTRRGTVPAERESALTGGLRERNRRSRPEPGWRDPRGGRARGRRVPCDGLPGRQRVPRVSPDVRAAVETAIRQLGYTPNRAARSLVTRRSDSIAVVITEPTRPPVLRSVLPAPRARRRGRARGARAPARAPDARAQRRAAHRALPHRRPRRRRAPRQPPRRRPDPRTRSRRATSRSCSSGGRPRAPT